MINWPKELITDIARRKCVLYIGSGISSSSKNKEGKSPATWHGFLSAILEKNKTQLKSCQKILTRLLKKEDYLTACEIIVKHLGEREFGEIAADEFRRPGYSPNKLHEIIYSLDSRFVITPNIDKIYDQYAQNQSKATIIIKTYYEEIARYLRSSDYLIIKAHGTIDETDRIVFTHSQYNKARNENSSFYKILDALLLTHTFIFLGCGLNDPDIQLVMENLHFSFPGCRPHYMVIPSNKSSSDELDCITCNRNIKFLKYPNADGTHSSLQNDLLTLAKLVESERENIAKFISW